MERSIHEHFLQTPENQRLYQQEKLLVEVTELLAEVMDKKKMSRAELARAIGKSKAFVSQVLSGNHNMTLRTVADLFGALRYDIVIHALPYVGDEEEVPDLDLSLPSGRYAFLSYHFAQQAKAALPRPLAPTKSKDRGPASVPQSLPPGMNVAA
jgi:transcriptional regulator with XRE-family HTH domain